MKRRRDKKPGRENTPSTGRDEAGHFLPGFSGNPGGRPGVVKEVRELAQADSPEAYRKVAAIMRDDKHRNQLPAALAVLKMAGVAMTADALQDPPPPPLGGEPRMTDAALTASLVN